MTRHRHQWLIKDDEATCFHCGVPYNPITSKRGRNNRRRGNSHELAVARKYGGEKVGPLGLPEDIRGDRWATQVKTRQGSPPVEWTAIFQALEGSRGDLAPRLLIRYLRGPGLKPIDFIVVRGDDWLDEFGKDGSEEAA
jgi:hypothetical protein